jgi:predicted metalloprotease with PDZ domain
MLQQKKYSKSGKETVIHYQIKPASLHAHIFEIRLTIPNPDPEGQKLTLPAWIPGSYMIRDFARYIVSLEAICSGKPLTADKQDKQTWQCESCSGELVIVYQVYAWDLSVRSAHLDSTHGYFNGTSVFLKVVGQEQHPCEVELLPPEGDNYTEWRVATTLPRKDAEHLSFGSYQAGNYDELIDHPVEMGTFTHATFDVHGTPHEIAITGRHDCDMERLCRDLKLICEYQVKLFGELPQMERYLFQVMAVGDGYGGLEHRSSTSLLCKRGDLPQPGVEEVTKEYRQFLGLCSHEYFHLWNVKRIRPQVFKSADLSREVHSKLLWAFEGITSYYDDLTLLRSGLIDAESYLELLAQNITRVMRRSGRLKQTVEESSFDAWTKFYKQDENAPNSIVSYYAKGAIIALALDLTIRRDSKGEKSLDDLMRTLWQRYGKPDIGVGEDEIEKLAAEVTGLDLNSFFNQSLRSTDDLSLEQLLETVAVGYELRPAAGSKDEGGVKKDEQKPNKPKADLGILHKSDSAGVKLTAVMDTGPAMEAGLSAGDVLIALDGIKTTSSNLDKLLERAQIGERVEIHAFRRDELMRFEVTMRPSEPNTCYLWLRQDATQEQRSRQQIWMNQ